MGVHWKIWFFQGGGGTQTKSGQGGWGWTVFRIKGEGGLVKKRGGFSLPHFGRQGASHYITKSADSQTNINFSENNCITAENLQKRLSNKWLQTEDLRKQKSIWKNSNLVETDASGQSRFFYLLPNILPRMVGVYYSRKYIVNMSDSIKTEIISVASKNGDYIKKNLKISYQKI